MKDSFELSDEVIREAYPDCDNRGNGWWGAKVIPNYGILRGAIAKAIVAASQQAVTPDTCNCGSKKPSDIYMPVSGFICPDCKGWR